MRRRFIKCFAARAMAPLTYFFLSCGERSQETVHDHGKAKMYQFIDLITGWYRGDIVGFFISLQGSQQLVINSVTKSRLRIPQAAVMIGKQRNITSDKTAVRAKILFSERILELPTLLLNVSLLFFSSLSAYWYRISTILQCLLYIVIFSNKQCARLVPLSPIPSQLPCRVSQVLVRSRGS